MDIQRGGTFFLSPNLVKSIRDWALPISMSKPEVCLVPATFLVDPHSALHFKTLMQVAFEIKIGLVQSPAFHFVQRRARQPPSLLASQFTICSSRFAPLRVFSLVHGQSYQTPNSSKNLFRAAHALNKQGRCRSCLLLVLAMYKVKCLEWPRASSPNSQRPQYRGQVLVTLR